MSVHYHDVSINRRTLPTKIPFKASLFSFSIVFGNSEQYTTGGVSEAITHMEQDFYKEYSSILFTNYVGIQTTNGMQTTYVLQTNYGKIFSFTQINKTHVVYPNSSQHCIQIFSRKNPTAVTVLGGRCNSNPSVFNLPNSVIVDQLHPGKVLITDAASNAIKSLDIRTGKVATILSQGINDITKMMWWNDILLIRGRDANSLILYQVKWDANDIPILSSSNKITELLRSSRLYLHGTVMLSKQYLLFIEHYSVLMFDMKKERLIPVCL